MGLPLDEDKNPIRGIESIYSHIFPLPWIYVWNPIRGIESAVTLPRKIIATPKEPNKGN